MPCRPRICGPPVSFSGPRSMIGVLPLPSLSYKATTPQILGGLTLCFHFLIPVPSDLCLVFLSVLKKHVKPLLFLLTHHYSNTQGWLVRAEPGQVPSPLLAPVSLMESETVVPRPQLRALPALSSGVPPIGNGRGGALEFTVCAGQGAKHFKQHFC